MEYSSSDLTNAQPVDDTAIRTAEGWLADRRSIWEDRHDTQGRYLTEGQDARGADPTDASRPVSRTKRRDT